MSNTPIFREERADLNKGLVYLQRQTEPFLSKLIPSNWKDHVNVSSKSGSKIKIDDDVAHLYNGLKHILPNVVCSINIDHNYTLVISC